jgi:hypothetical protein
MEDFWLPTTTVSGKVGEVLKIDLTSTPQEGILIVPEVRGLTTMNFDVLATGTEVRTILFTFQTLSGELVVRSGEFGGVIQSAETGNETVDFWVANRGNDKCYLVQGKKTGTIFTKYDLQFSFSPSSYSVTINLSSIHEINSWITHQDTFSYVNVPGSLAYNAFGDVPELQLDLSGSTLASPNVEVVTDSMFVNFLFRLKSGDIIYAQIRYVLQDEDLFFISKVPVAKSGVTIYFDFELNRVRLTVQSSQFALLYDIGITLVGIVFRISSVVSKTTRRFLPGSPDGSLPTILGTVRLTPDGNQICNIDYTLIETAKVKKYVQYSPSFLGEVVGCGDSIPERVVYLNRFFPVDEATFVEYVAVRTILSSVLFGSFSTKYLRRRYYCEFLSRLAKSDWKAFMAYFSEGNYYLLFRE